MSDTEAEFLGTTAYPLNPETGRRVYRTDLAGLYRYDGAAWERIGGEGAGLIFAQDAEPSPDPSDPALWYDLDATAAGGGDVHHHDLEYEPLHGTGGSSFPVSPAEDDRYFRTDKREGMEFQWNGTYWLSTEQFAMHFYYDSVTAANAKAKAILPEDMDTYLVAATIGFYIEGTQHLGADSMAGTIQWADPAQPAAWTDIFAFETTDSHSATAWHKDSTVLTTLLQTFSAASRPQVCRLEMVATSSPSASDWVAALYYRLRTT